MKKLEKLGSKLFEEFKGDEESKLYNVIGGVTQIMGGNLEPDGSGGFDSYRDILDVTTGEVECHVSCGKDSADWDPFWGQIDPGSWNPEVQPVPDYSTLSV